MTKVGSIPALGDTGPDVLALQKAVKEAGYDPGTLDGVFGPNLKAAVSKFQLAKGLNGSGILGPKSLEALGLEVVAVSPVSGQEVVTHDLVGKKSGRRLHPTLRLLIEHKLFPDGKVPDCFTKKDLVGMVKAVCVALESMKIREVGGNNHGPVVGMIQGIIGPVVNNGTGDAWCMSTVQCVVAFIEDFLGVESPIADSEHCLTVLRAAQRVPGLVSDKAEEGAAVVYQHGTTSNGHTGFVMKITSKTTMNTFEGNTGDGSMRDGDGAYFRVRNQKQNGSMYSRGFVRLYANDKIPEAAPVPVAPPA